MAALGLCHRARAFSSCGERGLLFVAGFSLWWLLLLQSTGSRHTGFSSCGLWALEHKLSSCGAQAQLLCGMWDLPGPEIEHVSPALAGRFLTNAPPGKPFQVNLFFFFNIFIEYNCFTTVCQFLLYNKVNQLYIYIYPHISSLLCLSPSHPPIPPLQVVTKHGADFPLLCGCFPIAILHLVVYICPCHSLTLSQLTLPPLCILHSLVGLRLYSRLARRFLKKTLKKK